MRLVDNWRRVLKHAWSIRLGLLSAALGAAEVGVNLLSSDPPIPRGTFVAIASAVSLASAVSRLVAQTAVSGPAPEGDR